MIIDKRSVTAQLTDYFKQQIEGGAWQVGYKIPSEHTLCAALKVSRSSVRTVISQFIALGILEPQQGKGTFLKRTDVDARLGSSVAVPRQEFKDIRQVLEYRLIIEPYAIAKAALMDDCSTVLLPKLRTLLQEMQDNVGNTAKFIAADLEFHLAIAHASRNVVLEASLSYVFTHTMKRHKQMNELFGFSDGVLYHKKIIAALEHADGKKAAAAMRKHLQNALDKLLN